MGLFQLIPAIYQWSRASKLFDLYYKNMVILFSYFQSKGFSTPDLMCEGERSITPRVSIFVSNREMVKKFFLKNNIELGQWFDGPLSPVPDNPIFNYQIQQYPNAKICARQIINFPCHCGLNEKDIKRMTKLIGQYDELYPKQIKKIKF
jgi:dTDP-4-amino-4,6-dideoxygalactose transaminase